MSLYIVDIHGELEGDYEIIKKYEEPTTKNNCAEQNGCITCSLDDGDDCCRKLYEESMQEPTTKNDLAVDYIDRAQAQTEIEMNAFRYTLAKERGGMGQVEWSDILIKVSDAVDIIRNLPSKTPLSSELEKNSKKLEKGTTKNDLGVDLISRNEVSNRLASIAKIKAKSDAQKSLMGRCMFMVESIPSVTPQLSVPEVTALAEWTEKLTKASEDAYNKGYTDGMKAQAEPKTGHWIDSSNGWMCSECNKDNTFDTNYCPNCGADMRGGEE